ncbi:MULTISPECIES: hypothetical protein [unclassified Pantoea]|uniref:hypothetical protein n=1 Tax=unclassified Pantoea TaxID=2630326 RepID=UPI0023D9FC11|nr:MULTISPECIES: hypothetical protein [unclassified Pantoea]MDF2043159.1 hypothetical protein [Pantoea sp. Cr_R14]MDF2071054.1 hypothetical protein [Pantoea sp. Cr_R13]MDF2080183.1 hypothetical protein [Pantoea sp. Cr_R21]
MHQNSDHPEDALSATSPKNRFAVSMLIFTLIAGAAAIMMLLEHRDSVNNALETGQCLAEEGAEDLMEVLRHFLHHAYRWIFKACG